MGLQHGLGIKYLVVFSSFWVLSYQLIHLQSMVEFDYSGHVNLGFFILSHRSRVVHCLDIGLFANNLFAE